MVENKIDVLDHGYVRLVDHMGSDLSVVRAARVSYDAAWRAGGDEMGDRRLIRYLWRNKHSTPFEAVTFTFEVVAPIFVLRQWHRHRTWSYNEVSGRYVVLPDQFYVPDPNRIGVQSMDNKQVRIIDDEVRNNESHMMHVTCMAAFKSYDTLLALGVPREVARMVLPLATYSHMFATVDLLNLFKFIALRDHEHAQWEIMQYAKALFELVRPIVPVCCEAFDDGRTGRL